MNIGPFDLGADGAVVVKTDALEALRQVPSASVDAVITDPPYSSGGFTRGDRALKDPLQKYMDEDSPFAPQHNTFTGDNRDQRAWLYWTALWLSEALRVTKPQGYIMMFCDWRQQPTASDAIQLGGWVWRGTVPWDKGRGARAPHPGYFRHQAEYVVWGTNGGCVSDNGLGGPFDGVIRYSIKPGEKHHPTGKPVQVMREVMAPVPVGGLILDPFSGSGSTHVAAIETRRLCLGFEMMDHHVETSRVRIAAARAGLRAVDPDQAPLFAAAP
jgi:site-specific DNA-methyltransferase (adenine-specific)